MLRGETRLARLIAFCLAAGLALTAACSSASSQPGGSQTKSSAPATAAAQQGEQINVTAKEFSFTPSQIEVQAGQPVTLNLKNEGQVRHDWVVRLGSENVRVVAEPGQTRSVTFTPSTAGTYEFICSEPGHEPAGMKGTLEVK